MKHKTVAGLIQRHVDGKTNMELATACLGREPSQLELAALAFLVMPQAMEQMKPSEDFRKAYAAMVYDHLLDGFCKALTERDSAALRAVADHLDRPQPQPVDNLRSKILLAKVWAPGKTAAELAEQIGYSGNMDVLRRVANKLGYPFQKGRVGRPKNTDSKPKK